MDDLDFLPDVIQVKTEEKRGKPHGALSHKTRKALALVIDHGVEPKEAYMLTHGKAPSKDAIARLKQKCDKYSLQRPALQKLATNAVKDTLQGKEVRYDAVKILANGQKVPYQEVVVPSYTNKLAAAAMVHDRVDPVVRQNMNLNVNAEISPVDLTKYLNRERT